MNKNGTVKEYTPIFSRHNMNLKLSEMDNFGESVLAIGDLDYDGITELLVGSNTYPMGDSYGTVYLLYLNRDGTVKKTVRISGIDGAIDEDDYLGTSLAIIGDLDYDGIQEIAIGAPGKKEKGAIFIVSLNKSGGIKDYFILDQTLNGKSLDNIDELNFGIS